MISNISIDKLKPHPRNKDIYGDESESIKELAELIRKSNMVTNLIINQNNVIISGHRRYYACLILNVKEVPCIQIVFKDENEELERLLLENQHREKTTHQKMKETKLWEGIEKEKAKDRQGIAGSRNLGLVTDSGPELDKREVRDILAEKVGLGSGKTYERAKPVMKKIDELKEIGSDRDAEFLITVLNESVRGAKDLSELESLDSISDELKGQVISKELPVQKAVQTIRKDLGIITDGMKGGEKKVEKICSRCGERKSLLEFYTGRTECINCHNTPKERKNKNFEGIDMDALEADVKNLNKSINDYDDEDITMEIEAAINTFVFSVKRYVDGEDTYENMNQTCRNKLINALENIENTIFCLKNKLN